MHKLIDTAKSFSDNDRLPIGVLAGGGIIFGLLVSETVYERESKSSLRTSSRGGGGFFTGHDGSMYKHVLDVFDTNALGADPRGLSVPLIHAVVAMGMMTAEIPAMRLDPQKVVSWWVTEHKIEGATFQGGGVGIGF